MTSNATIDNQTAHPVTSRFTVFTWLLIGLGIVILAFGAINAVLLAINSFMRPISMPSGQILYATTFNSSSSEWLEFTGELAAKVDKGALKITINKANDGAYSVLAYEFANFDARMNLATVSSIDAYSESGLLFRFRDRQNYYMFKLRADGFYRVERYQNGQIDVLSEWHASPLINVGIGAVNRLRVVAQGAVFKFFINDQALLLCPNGPGKQKSTWNGDQCLSNNGQTSAQLTDDTFPSGKIGAGVQVNDGGTEVDFTNVVVYAP